MTRLLAALLLHDLVLLLAIRRSVCRGAGGHEGTNVQINQIRCKYLVRRTPNLNE